MTVVGGMLAATMFAIFIIPVTFYVSERFRRRPEPVAPPHAAPVPIAGGTNGEHAADEKQP
jgi:HAE1 family hydrophobic/amphiphilic exporter-1